MPIGISTLGKFSGPPTNEASAKYGGGADSAPSPPKQPKFPKIKIKSINKKDKEEDININILSVEEKD